VVDLVEPRGALASPWELNLALGAGLTEATAATWMAKVIVGRGL
jgi:hypothetical protein